MPLPTSAAMPEIVVPLPAGIDVSKVHCAIVVEFPPPLVTFPPRAMVTPLAPVDERTRFPVSAPTEAVEAMRTLRVALALPEVCEMVAFEAKEVPSVETSKPVGALAVMLAVKLLPLTEMDWEAEALPAVVVKAVKLPVVERTGASGSMTVKAVALVADSSPTVTVMGPVVAPEGTMAVREVLLVKVTLLEAVPLKETVAFEAKFVPLMVMESQTRPEVGEKEVMVGWVEEVAVMVALKVRLPASPPVPAAVSAP